MTKEIPRHLPFELCALEKAVQYQQWMIEKIQPFLGTRILELGAGIGNMSRWFQQAERLILTEYDPELVQLLQKRLEHDFRLNLETVSLHCFDLNKDPLSRFQTEAIDTIISFNVIEHIENDTALLHQCADLLRQSAAPGKKRIISFLPAHPFAYGRMDKAVGHYRRYSQKNWRKLHAEIAPEAKLMMLPFNFCGLWGWLINGRLLRRKCAGTNMIGWVEKLSPLFKKIDQLLIEKYKIPLGQSLIVVQEWSC